VRVAVISQPWASALPPSESVAIWSVEVGQRLANSDEVLLLSRYGEPAEQGAFRHLPVSADNDWRVARLLEASSRLRPRDRPAFASALYHRGYFRRAVEAAVEAECDVVHLLNFSQPAPLVKRLRPQARVVLNMRCDWLSQLSPSLVRRRARHCDLILGVSHYVTERARRVLPAQRSETLHNGVDPSVFRPADGGAALPARVLFVGRVSPDKGVHTLLESFAGLARERPELELELIGDEALPPLEMQVRLDPAERVRALARFYGAGNYLAPLLTGLPAGTRKRISHDTWIGRDQLAERYRGAGVLVLPSVVDEAFGIPLVEAMASGIPVVATRVGGIPEVVEHGVTGLLVPPEDPAALAEAIRMLLDDPPLARRMGEAGRRRAVEHFSWDAVTAQLRGLYQELL
jgi:glycosyltransferase involved in cell wall biosynthesis